VTMNKTKNRSVKQVFSTLSLPPSLSLSSLSVLACFLHPLEDRNPPRFFVGVAAAAPELRTCALHASNSSSAILPLPGKAAAAAFVEVGSGVGSEG